MWMSPTGSPISSPVTVDVDRRAHAAEDLDVGDAGRVQAHALERQVRAGHDARRDHEERGRRRVARARRSRTAAARPACTRTVRSSGRSSVTPERAEHPLGVVAARRRLHDLGGAVGLEAREDERRLHLAARGRELVADAAQPAAAHRDRCEPAAVAPVDRARPWPRADRARVASAASTATRRRPAPRGSRGPATQPGEHAHRRARVRAVEHRRRLAQAGEPVAAHRERVVDLAHADAEGVEAGGGRGDVGAVGQAADRGPTVGDGREQQRPVRDPLAAGQRAGGRATDARR